MEYNCLAVTKKQWNAPKKEELIPLIAEEGIIIQYLRETIKNVRKSSISEVKTEAFCETMGIKCDELILRAINKGMGASRYKINLFHICAGVEEISVMLVLREIMPENYSESLTSLYAHLFFKLKTDEGGEVIEINNQVGLFFPSVRPTPLPPID